jgi:hypothetical protein
MTFGFGIALGFGVGMVARFWLFRWIVKRLEAKSVRQQADFLQRRYGEHAIDRAIEISDEARWHDDGKGAVFWIRVVREIDGRG